MRGRYDVLLQMTFILLLILFFLGSTFKLPITGTIVFGGSMYPTAVSGDLAIGVSTSIIGFGEGDIVSYISESTYVMHRVLKIEGDTVVLVGDNNAYIDSPVPKDNVVYKIVFIVPYYLWTPILTITILAIYLLPLLRGNGEWGHTIYYPLMLVFLFTIVFMLSMLSTIEAGYSVKLNPMVEIESITKLSDGRYLVEFTYPLDNVDCFPSQCEYLGRAVIIGPESGNVIIKGTVEDRVNLQLIYSIHLPEEVR